MARVRTAPQAWKRFAKDRKFAFVYPWHMAERFSGDTIGSGEYGIVQVRCIDLAVCQTFMKGFQSGKRAGLLAGMGKGAEHGK